MLTTLSEEAYNFLAL